MEISLYEKLFTNTQSIFILNTYIEIINISHVHLDKQYYKILTS